MEDLPKLEDDDKITVREEKEVERFTFSLLGMKVLQFFNFEKGFLPTVKLLVINPGKHIKAYLSIDRDRLTNPFKFYLVIGALYFLLLYLSEDLTRIRSGIDSEWERDVFQAVVQYFHVYILLLVFFVAIYSYLFFRKESGYNLVENLILNLYVMSIIFVIAIITYPLEGKFHSYGDNFIRILACTYFFYAYLSFFKGTYIKTFGKTLLSIFLGVCTSLLTLLLVVVVAVIIVEFVL